jgi:hypothetical protein
MALTDTEFVLKRPAGCSNKGPYFFVLFYLQTLIYNFKFRNYFVSQNPFLQSLLIVTVFWNITPCILVRGTNVTAKIYPLQDGIGKFNSKVMKTRDIMKQEATRYKCPLYLVPDHGRFSVHESRIHQEFTASRRSCDISWTAWGKSDYLKLPADEVPLVIKLPWHLPCRNRTKGTPLCVLH